MNIYFNLVFWGFVAVYLIVTFQLSKKTPTLDEFYTMNHGAGPWLIAGTYTATWISAFGMVAVAGVSYSIAPLAGILMWGAVIGYIITGFVIGPRLRRFGQVTLGDFFGDRFDSDFLRLLSALIVIVGLTAYFVAQTMGSAIITNIVFGIPYNVMVVVMAAIFVFIAATTGSKSVTITDTIMVAVIAVALGYIFSPILMGHIGIDNISNYAKENPKFFTYGGGKILFSTIVGWQIIWALGNASMPQAVSRCYLARSNADLYKAILISLVVTMSAVWLTHLASASVKVVNPDLPGTQTLTWAALHLVGPVVGALAAAGLFAAALSTATTQVMYLSFSVSRDIYERVIAKKRGDKPSDKKVLFVTRMWIIIFGIIGAGFAIWRPAQLIQFGNLAASIFAASFFPILILGLFWRRCTKEGAVVGMILGFVSILVMYYIAFLFKVPFGKYNYLPWGLHPIYWGVGIVFIATWLISLFTKTTEKQNGVFNLVSTPGEVDVISVAQKRSLLKWVYAVGAYTVIQTAAIFWFASKV